MRLAAGTFAILVAAAPALGADRPVPLTRESVRTMAPEELARRVFGELGHVMYALPFREPRGSGASTMPLTALEFLTRPRRSYRAGLCETDSIMVGFERIPYALGRDPAMRPYRFDVYKTHFVQDFGQAREGGPPVDSAADQELDRACAAIDPRGVHRIVASEPFSIVAGLDLLADLVEAAKAGRALAPLDCQDVDGKPVAESVCMANLARLDPRKLYLARSGESCERSDPDHHCRLVKIFDRGESVDILFELRRRGEQAPVRILVKPSFDESSLIG